MHSDHGAAQRRTFTGIASIQGFGVAYRNGYAEPWAYGYNPPFDLRQNTSLLGNVTWQGTLLGFTPRVQAVAGNASVSVNMSSLTGRADFAGLEYCVRIQSGEMET